VLLNDEVKDYMRRKPNEVKIKIMTMPKYKKMKHKNEQNGKVKSRKLK